MQATLACPAACCVPARSQDTTAPTIQCPGNSTRGSGATKVTYDASTLVSATDNSGATLTDITFSPADTDALSLGDNTVTATVKDADGNTATCSFGVTVTVRLAAVAAHSLRTLGPSIVCGARGRRGCMEWCK